MRIAILVLALLSPVFADVVHLKNGSKMEGKVLSETETEVVVRMIGAAVADFTEGLSRNPRLWVARLGRGQVHEKLGEHAAAADDYQAAYDVVGETYPGLPDMIRRARGNTAKDPHR